MRLSSALAALLIGSSLTLIAPAALAGRASSETGINQFNPTMDRGTSFTPEDDPDSGGPTPAAVPIDGGVSWLALAGAGYALRRLRRRRAAGRQ